MTIGCNIWMICLILIWFFYGLSRKFQRPQFVWALRSLVWDVFNNFLPIDAKDKSKISSDQKRFFIALSLYPLSFFANAPFKIGKFFPLNLPFLAPIYKIWHLVCFFSNALNCLKFLYFLVVPPEWTDKTIMQGRNGVEYTRVESCCLQ